ncbi:MAG: glycosyltransferase family 4 protein [Thermoleophilia bacterium]
MRVGLVTPYSWTVPGGVNNHVEYLSAELEGRGHEVWIIAPVGALTPRRRSVDSRQQPWAERFIPMGAAVPVPSNGSRAYLGLSPRVFTRMDRALRYGRFDVVHVHEPCTPTVAGAAVLLASSPVVGTFHAALVRSFGYERLAWLAAAVMRCIDVRIAVSEAAREYPAGRFPGDYRIIPNGLAVEKYAPALGAAKVKGRILFIGRADRRKGLSVLLPAFARLRERLPHASLVIAGASRRQVFEAARTSLFEAPDLRGVEPLGWVADDVKVAQLAEAELVCAPSLAAESFGIVLAEAMAAGVPVVASDLPGYRSVLRGGIAGRLVPPGEPSALADALAELLGDEERRRRLAAAGIAAAADLSWRHVTDAIVTAYEDSLIAGARRGSSGLPGPAWFGHAVAQCVVAGSRSGHRPAAETAGAGSRRGPA